MKIRNKLIVLIAAMSLLLVGCDEASRVRENLAQEADNFNCVRRITVVDCITGDTLFQMEGRSSIVADKEDNQLEIITEYQKGSYSKQIIGLSDNVTYIIEDLETTPTDPYHYKINFNPNMWTPVAPDVID